MCAAQINRLSVIVGHVAKASVRERRPLSTIVTVALLFALLD
jgi:hypothetical protein